jgi:hypothetical protein
MLRVLRHHIESVVLVLSVVGSLRDSTEIIAESSPSTMVVILSDHPEVIS